MEWLGAGSPPGTDDVATPGVGRDPPRILRHQNHGDAREDTCEPSPSLLPLAWVAQDVPLHDHDGEADSLLTHQGSLDLHPASFPSRAFSPDKRMSRIAEHVFGDNHLARARLTALLPDEAVLVARRLRLRRKDTADDRLGAGGRRDRVA